MRPRHAGQMYCGGLKFKMDVMSEPDMIVSSILWVACGTETETAVITVRSLGALAAEHRHN